MASRASSYTIHEDILLCEIYIQISQDPIVGRYQSASVFWDRVTNEYNNSKGVEWEVRTDRSLQSRWHAIEVAVRKLKACLNQIENRNPSGTQEQDRLHRAKLLFAEDKKFKKGFKFDHVWHIVKDFAKFDDNAPVPRQRIPTQMTQSSGSENPTPEIPTQDDHGLSSFNLNLSSEDTGGSSSSKRPMGVKKAKLKKKSQEQLSSAFNNLEARNEELMEMLKKADEDRKKQMEMQAKLLELRKKRDEDKILMKDLNSIIDPGVRAYIQRNQIEIIERRTREQQQSQPPSSSTMPGFEFLNDFGKTGEDLPNYRD